MSDITFRDFAGALMGEDHALAAKHLQALLGVDAETAARGTEHFVTQMKASPEFMMKAMSMRTVVEAGDRAALAVLLADCFALDADTVAKATDVVLGRYT